MAGQGPGNERTELWPHSTTSCPDTAGGEAERRLTAWVAKRRRLPAASGKAFSRGSTRATGYGTARRGSASAAGTPCTVHRPMAPLPPVGTKGSELRLTLVGVSFQAPQPRSQSLRLKNFRRGQHDFGGSAVVAVAVHPRAVFRQAWSSCQQFFLCCDGVAELLALCPGFSFSGHARITLRDWSWRKWAAGGEFVVERGGPPLLSSPTGGHHMFAGTRRNPPPPAGRSLRPCASTPGSTGTPPASLRLSTPLSLTATCTPTVRTNPVEQPAGRRCATSSTSREAPFRDNASQMLDVDL